MARKGGGGARGKGGGGRSYARNANGQFASTGGGGAASGKKPQKPPLPPGLTRSTTKPPPPPRLPAVANKIAAIPRRLNAAEKAYSEIKAQKSKFRSDRKILAEMERRGFINAKDKQGQLIRIASNARRKQGIGRDYTSYFN